MLESAVAIITARGGSKRIQRKNIKSFLGKPILEYSIVSALDAGCFSEVMVSTDDSEIADLAKKLGARVPFFRSKETSGDFAVTAQVVEEVLLEYGRQNRIFSHACCLYPTAPFVTPDRLRSGLALLKERDADGVVPVVRFGFPIQRAFRLKNGFVEMLWPENCNIRSQDLEPTFHDAAQFYWLNVERFLKLKIVFMPHTVALEVPEEEVQDIDHESDWRLAEMKYELLRRSR